MNWNVPVASADSPVQPVPLCIPHLGGREWDYLKDCLDTGWVSSVGPYVSRLEQQVSALAGHKQGVATTSGTAALHLALLLAGVGPGDEVLVSNLTFMAPVNAIRYLQAEPVLVDCDPTTWQIDTNLVERFFRESCTKTATGCHNRITGRRVGAVIPVHLLGHPVDIDPLISIAEAYAVPVIEDASESLGAGYKGGPVGRHGMLSCFSFNGNKIVTAGGGGVLTCRDDELARRGRYLSTQAKDDSLYYVHEEVGYNYRLTNIQAALAVAQLEQLGGFIQAKKAIARRYEQGLKGFAPDQIELPSQQPWADSTWWLYTVLLNGKHARRRDEILQQLISNGIQARPLWNPAHRNKPFRSCQLLSNSSSIHSERIADCSISLPSSVSLEISQQERVIEVLARLLQSR